jgi:hypothetical protein
MKKLLLLLLISFPWVLPAQDFGLKISGGTIEYQTDERGNRIIDFSYCGYRLSEEALPQVTNRVFVPHQHSDASSIIQQAIDYVSLQLPDEQGFRGAVQLDSGTFILTKPLRIAASGVIIRGNRTQPTQLLKKGYDRGAVIYLEGKADRRNETTVAVSTYTPAGALQIEVNGNHEFKIGDRLMINRTSSKEWIARLGCDVFGGGIGALGWKPGDMDLAWDRTVLQIDGNTLTFNAPLPMALDPSEAGVSLQRYCWPGRIHNSGVEHLIIVADYDQRYPKDEDHAWTGVSIENAEDCWVRKVHFRHLAGSGVILQASASRITVQDCMYLEPVSEVGGMRRSAFLNLGQLNLVQRCYAERAIHAFGVGMNAPGPNAFVQCQADEALGFSGATDSWAPGVLFDIVNIDGQNLSFSNLGQFKNGAGWTTANSMFWQCTAAVIECFSPPGDQLNRAYGCWAQFNGNGLWAEANNHVQPRSFFYAQLAQRLKNDVSAQALLLPLNTNATSSPTVTEAARLAEEARQPLLTLQQWIQQIPEKEDVDNTLMIPVNRLFPVDCDIAPVLRKFSMEDGRLLYDGQLLTGHRAEVNWWSGKLRTPGLTRVRPHITRFVPGREGSGLTDRIDSVLSAFKTQNIIALDHNYGLWYDRRRDDHQRVRRADGDVLAPFYEQPFARSGVGTAWDGLSKYDLTRPNNWYWMRQQQFAQKAEQQGIMLWHQHFFQHNILEAGAHWVDSPWRTANNINHTGFPEPVNFAGDKRVFMADMFYDLSHEGRKALYRQYIRTGLEMLSAYSNVVHFLSTEYTGPLHFMQFWLDVVAEWEAETGRDVLVALSATKDVQDAILADPVRAKALDVIDIRYWHYRNDGTVYAPEGGQHLAPRQHARLEKVGKTGFNEVFRAVSEYRAKHPAKAVLYNGQASVENALAVFLAGGSCAAVPSPDKNFLKEAALIRNLTSQTDQIIVLGNTDTGFIIFSQSETDFTIPEKGGFYVVKQINMQNGEISIVRPVVAPGETLRIPSGRQLYWLQKR